MHKYVDTQMGTDSVPKQENTGETFIHLNQIIGEWAKKSTLNETVSITMSGFMIKITERIIIPTMESLLRKVTWL